MFLDVNLVEMSPACPVGVALWLPEYCELLWVPHPHHETPAPLGSTAEALKLLLPYRNKNEIKGNSYFGLSLLRFSSHPQNEL